MVKDSSEKRENAYRELAKLIGFRLEKSAKRKPTVYDKGLYRLYDNSGHVILGGGWDAELSEIGEYLCHIRRDRFVYRSLALQAHGDGASASPHVLPPEVLGQIRELASPYGIDIDKVLCFGVPLVKWETLDEAAARTGLNRYTVGRLARQRKIRTGRTGQGKQGVRTLVDGNDLDRYLIENAISEKFLKNS